MAFTADILRRAASLIDAREVDNALEAIDTAAEAAAFTWAERYEHIEEALKALAAHLNYATDRDPSRDLRRWSRLRTPAQMATQMRSAADTAERGAL